jgi:serpin B
MADVLHLPADQAECHDAMAKIRKALVKANGRRGIELNVANGLWPQEGYEFNKAFLRLAKSKYDAHVEFVDFLAPGDGVRSKINAWIEENTNRLIKNAIGRGLLSPATRLVIVNAIYFKGQWVSRFDKAETKPAPFWVSAAESVEAPMMHQEDYFRYGEGEAVQLVELPYGKHDLSMIVLLPKARDNLAERDGLAKLDEQLTPEQLSGWLGGLTVCYVDVLLPKLKIVSSFSLKGALAAMGMPDAFSPADADFTGMTEERPFFIMAVEHAALVDVDEEGTEAAAVTVVTGGCAAAGPPRATFHADHPFVFMIRDNRTGTILFMGRVLDPTR